MPPCLVKGAEKMAENKIQGAGGGHEPSLSPVSWSVAGEVGGLARYSETIKNLVLTILGSPRTHALIVSGDAGWAKSTSVSDALEMAGVRGAHLATHSTALHLFNFLHDHAREVVVLDDCAANLFSDPISMAILK
jgi:hypothetical protein